MNINEREEGILKMTSQCKKNNVYAEGLNLAEWRVYNLHRSTMKTGGGKQTNKGIGIYPSNIKRRLMCIILVSEASNTQPESSKGFDPVRDAIKASNQ